MTRVKHRVGAILSVVAAIVVLAAAAYVVHSRTKVPTAGQTPGVVPLSSTPASATPTLSPSPSPSPSPPQAQLVVAFIGDDYTTGVGASSPAKGFVPVLAGMLKIAPHAFGVPGGGYAKPSPDGRTYVDVLDAVAAIKPSIVVVTGGRNDQADDPDTLTAAVATFFATLHGKLPSATVVAVTPFWGDSAAPTQITKLAGTVHDTVRSISGTYIDLLDPLLTHSSFMADANDPNDAGYAAIATALAGRLQPLITAGSHSKASSSGSSRPSGQGSSGSTTASG
jgi:lysophospholipase L1-like esterase